MKSERATGHDIRVACHHELAQLQEHFLLSAPVRLLWTRKLLPPLRGFALLKERQIAMSLKKIDATSRVDEWITTTRHEFAHFLALETGEVGHEQAWGRAARQVGVPEDEVRLYVDTEAEQQELGINPSLESALVVKRCHYCRRFPAVGFCVQHRMYFCNVSPCHITGSHLICPKCDAEE